MTSEAAVWIIAGLEVVAALIIAAYWVTWFREPHDEPWLPDGYVDHEAPFVYTDTILALLLVVAAVLQVFEEPLGDSLGLVAAGMLAFLGVLDLAYFARTGLFKREHDGILNGGVVASVLFLSIILILRFV